ncbi:MAG: phosphoribulokinase [Cutibacterium sp.]|nr:phosphoribulokinase [Cutibacterium sp.]
MPRPVMIGIVGDSAAGKTTITRGLVRVLGEENVTHICTDDYHKYDRKQRAERNITPLHPECNYIDIMERHLGDLRLGHAILKPVYQHKDGTFGPPVYVKPKTFTVVEGLLAFHTPAMRDAFDVRIFLDPPEELRRKWKVARDTTKRGYTTDQVLSELDRREPDSAAFIRPQKQHADMVISFQPKEGRDQHKLDAYITLHPGLPHPELSAVVNGESDGLELKREGEKQILFVPGNLEPTRATVIEEYIWEKLHFAQHLRSNRLGEFTTGTSDLLRSESLAITQLLILYHVITSRASVALGGEGTRSQPRKRSLVEKGVGS